MQFQVFFELGQSDKPYEGCLPHLVNVLKSQMIRDQRFDLFGVIVREPEFLANSLRHSRAYLDVTIEPDACTRSGGRRKGRRLADIVQQHAPSQGRTAI